MCVNHSASNFGLLLLSYYFTVEIFTVPIGIKLEIGATGCLHEPFNPEFLVQSLVCMSFWGAYIQQLRVIVCQ